MKKIVFLFATLSLLSCDNGNIDIPELDFTNDIDQCGSFVLYKINGSEALVIEIDRDEDFFETESATEIPLSESGTNTIVYRTFNTDVSSAYFCNNIPPSTPTIVNEWLGTGTLNIITTLESTDDNDGVPFESEGLDTNGELINDNIDGDAFENYIDTDDDDDGILTEDEDVDGDGDPTNDDTDGDGMPNYLDNDDDGDSILTINEDINENGNPDDDDSNANGISNYLDDQDVFTSNTPLPDRENIYTQEFISTLEVILLELTNAANNTINFDVFDFGIIETTKTIFESDKATNK